MVNTYATSLIVRERTCHIEEDSVGVEGGLGHDERSGGKGGVAEMTSSSKRLDEGERTSSCVVCYEAEG